ncbi:MAG: hypothetical protein ACREYE_22775 [Gammaproteobacteria bacterium]
MRIRIQEFHYRLPWCSQAIHPGYHKGVRQAQDGTFAIRIPMRGGSIYEILLGCPMCGLQSAQHAPCVCRRRSLGLDGIP